MPTNKVEGLILELGKHSQAEIAMFYPDAAMIFDNMITAFENKKLIAHLKTLQTQHLGETAFNVIGDAITEIRQRKRQERTLGQLYLWALAITISENQQ